MKSIVTLLICLFTLGGSLSTFSQESVARQWNEVLLEAIRNDFARPTVHARNLWHTSIGMYDAWAAYDEISSPYFLGNTLGNYTVPFVGVQAPDDIQAAQEEAMSYAAYRLLRHRFQFSPGGEESLALFDELMLELGYDIVYANTDYENEPPAALGNYIADNIIQFGLGDGANEQADYANQYYIPVNDPLDMSIAGNLTIDDPNRWQPLELPEFIDQGGNPFTVTPPFLSPEWGNVVPFALADSVKSEYQRDGDPYIVYHDPSAPPQIDTLQEAREYNEAYRWGFEMVTVWSSHLSPNDGVVWDISPANIGNITWYPENFDEYDQFYNFEDGGDIGEGHDINPATGEPYTPQYVPRGDYTRILAEFWADGPDSETPPGHWFSILNYVNDNPLLEKRWRGEGPVLDDLEWDVKSYFTLSGAMHDAAVSAWGVKGYYDYIRPVSALRFMAEKGQSTDEELPSFHLGGIQLIDGLIELVYEGDELAGEENEHVGKIKLYAWKGPDYIEDEEVDQAGVDWILAENWWPYQRPTFVTPPFAGYVSGHSTYSRAAAEVMTLMTGDPFFPGGMGEFDAPANEFLVFEEGPSTDITLQWATYRDASDQCSLSRIWGGIHPPADDIPGREIGAKVGVHAFIHAQEFIEAGLPRITELSVSDERIGLADVGQVLEIGAKFDREMDVDIIPTLEFTATNPEVALNNENISWISADSCVFSWEIQETQLVLENIDIQLTNAADLEGLQMPPYEGNNLFSLDMIIPIVIANVSNETLINESLVDEEYHFTIEFDEEMDQSSFLEVNFAPEYEDSFIPLLDDSEWITSKKWRAYYAIQDDNLETANIGINVSGVTDLYGNSLEATDWTISTEIDTKAPSVQFVLATEDSYDWESETFSNEVIEIVIIFDEEMDITVPLVIGFENEDPSALLELQDDLSGWISTTNYVLTYAPLAVDGTAADVDILISEGLDAKGNQMEEEIFLDVFSLDLLLTLDEIDDQPMLVYPNPVEQGRNLTIQFSDIRVGASTMRIVNESGQLMVETSIPSGVNRIAIPISMASGFYVLSIDNEAGQSTIPFVVR